MFGKGNKLALRYAIYRTHLLERHINALYSALKDRLPDEAETFDTLINGWQEEVGEMHGAFLDGDEGYFDQYEQKFPEDGQISSR